MGNVVGGVHEVSQGTYRYVSQMRVWKQICDMYNNLNKNGSSVTLTKSKEGDFVSDCGERVDEGTLYGLIGDGFDKLVLSEGLKDGKILVVRSCIGYIKINSDRVAHVGSADKLAKMPDYHRFIPNMDNYGGSICIPPSLQNEIDEFNMLNYIDISDATLWCLRRSANNKSEIVGYKPYSDPVSYVYGSGGINTDPVSNSLIVAMCQFIEDSGYDFDEVWWPGGYAKPNGYVLQDNSQGESIFVICKNR